MARPRARSARATTALALLVAVVSHFIGSASALGPPEVGDTSACESCLVFGHILYDAVGDPYVESKLSEYLIGSICPNFDDKQSCEANVNNLVEALVAWMRANLEPEDLCHQAGLCATARDALPGVPPTLSDLLRALASAAASSPDNADAPPPPRAPPVDPTEQKKRSALSPHLNPVDGPKDVTCPLCMFVLTKIKDALSDPITREKVHDAGLKACASLPGGDAAKSIRDACVDFLERNEGEIYDFIDQTEPGDLCEKLNACMPPAHQVPTLAALDDGTTRLYLDGYMPAGTMAMKMEQPLRRLSDGNCDVCLAVVKDLHRAIASPEVQDQATALAKQACDALPSGGGGGGGASDLATQCKAGVDQYAPLVFGMALAYLQPATLCAQVHLCPAPSPSVAQFAATLKASRDAWALLGHGGEGGGGARGGAGSPNAYEMLKAVKERLGLDEERLEREYGIKSGEDFEKEMRERLGVAAS